ncbi:hypothetical protein FSP39_013380 [Pinctada imbricata]|uniref:Uncharacterized protein n=1 Tax=Pinctada imbricata TaxID=66713 RepID=A0AA88XNI2_PINIB|nr:hypothetical protein FSP39_013380 [Pinctada imbricata]
MRHTYFTQRKDDKIFIPGDRVCFNNVELFDILMHDSISNVTYLYHVKEGLGQTTRDACSQIRVSAQLFWMDRLQGKQTNALGFYQKATSSSTAESPYREELRKRMERIGEETFINMLQQKLIFVYAFLSKTVKEKLHPADLSDFKPITPSDFGKNGEDIVRSLKELNILTDLGYLDDTFLDITKDGFPTSAKKNAYLDTLKKTRLEAIYDTLVKHGRCKVSTIAKMELLELNRQFTEYQIAGEKVFELKVVKI